MKRRPVSAIVPVKNGSLWLPRLADFCSQELLASDEVIIIDDSSEDNSLRVAKGLNFGRATKIILKNSGDGLVDALNFGISKASKEWIARFDIDDEYVLGRLKEQFACATDEVVLIFSDFRVLINGEEDVGLFLSPVFDLPTKLSLARSQRTAHPIALIKKSALINAGGYLHDEYPAEDLGLWLRMSSLGKFSSAPNVLLKYNWRSSSISSQNYALIKKISKDLFTQYYRQDILKRLSPGEILDIFNSYRQLPKGRARQLLFIYDLLSKPIRKETSLEQKLAIARLSIFVMVHIRYLPVIVQFALKKIQRHKVRKQQSKT